MSRKKGLVYSALQTKTNKNLLDNVLANVLNDIDARITTSHSSGVGHVRYDLPTTFGIGTIRDTEAQFYIYSEIINQFVLPENEGGKGFDPEKVWLEKTDKTVILVVYWENGMDADEKAWRLELLKSYTRIK
jgi:hypothetical protein